jgi:cytochrome bd-type quinol oxidase subunit 2
MKNTTLLLIQLIGTAIVLGILAYWTSFINSNIKNPIWYILIPLLPSILVITLHIFTPKKQKYSTVIVKPYNPKTTSAFNSASHKVSSKLIRKIIKISPKRKIFILLTIGITKKYKNKKP